MPGGSGGLKGSPASLALANDRWRSLISWLSGYGIYWSEVEETSLGRQIDVKEFHEPGLIASSLGLVSDEDMKHFIPCSYAIHAFQG